MRVESQFVGVLADLAVNDGEMVSEGEIVCYVESMKTMFPIYAPISGRVTFLAELGEMVGEGEAVAEIEAV